MDSSQFIALVAQAAIKAGVPMERLGLTINAVTSAYAATSKFPAQLVTEHPAHTNLLGTRDPCSIVATSLHCLKMGRKVYCEQIGFDVFRVYW
jgi:hypothetical protein